MFVNYHQHQSPLKTFLNLPPLNIPNLPKMYRNSQILNWKVTRITAKQLDVLIKVVLNISETEQFTLMIIDF